MEAEENERSVVFHHFKILPPFYVSHSDQSSVPFPQLKKELLFKSIVPGIIYLIDASDLAIIGKLRKKTEISNFVVWSLIRHIRKHEILSAWIHVTSTFSDPSCYKVLNASTTNIQIALLSNSTRRVAATQKWYNNCKISKQDNNVHHLFKSIFWSFINPISE